MTVPATVLPGQGRIAGFDGLRAIAVVATISVHLGHRWLDGVALFFVLSGFLITGIMLKDGDRSTWRFWGRRVLRLYPALLLYLLGMWVFVLAGWASVPWLAFVAGALYLTNYVPFPLLARETSHLWSLAVEEQFYLLWPIVMFWARRLALPACAVGISVSCWWRVNPPTDPTRYVDRYFLPAADAILIGCFVALVVCGRPEHPVVRAVLRSPATLITGLAVLAYPWVMSIDWDAQLDQPAYLEAQRLALVLVLLWVCGNQHSWVVRALEVPPLRYLGMISYGVYLWQGLFVRNGPGDPRMILHEWPWNVIATFGAAVLSYELVERRFLALKDRFRSPGGTLKATQALARSEAGRVPTRGRTAQPD